MGNRAIIILMLFCAKLTAQNNIQFNTQIQRCLIGGVPIENCFAVSNAQGKFNVMTVENVNSLIQAANASAVDSIYSSNDTLYIDYFNAPTLAYYAPSLNGIYGSTNNNRQARVNTILYPSTGGGILEFKTQTTNLGRVQFNTPFNTPLSLYAQASQGYLIYGFPNASSRALFSVVGTNQYTFGAVGNKFTIRDQTALGVTRLAINPYFSTSDTALVIRGNGDIKLGAYHSGRTLDNTFDNLAWWDNDGILQKASKQALIDTINNNINVIDTGSVFPDLADSWEGRQFYYIPDRTLYYYSSGCQKYLSTQEYEIHFTLAGVTALDEFEIATPELDGIAYDVAYKYNLYGEGVTECQWRWKDVSGIFAISSIFGTGGIDAAVIGGAGQGDFILSPVCPDVSIVNSIYNKIESLQNGSSITDVDILVRYKKYGTPN